MNLKKSLALILLCSSISDSFANVMSWKDAVMVACVLNVCKSQLHCSMTRKDGESSMDKMKRFMSKCSETLSKGSMVFACQMCVDSLMNSKSGCTRSSMIKDICLNSAMMYAASDMDMKMVPMVGDLMDKTMDGDTTKTAMILACKPVADKMMNSVMDMMSMSSMPAAKVVASAASTK